MTTKTEAQSALAVLTSYVNGTTAPPPIPTTNPVTIPAGMKSFSGLNFVKDNWSNQWAQSYWSPPGPLAYNPANAKVVGWDGVLQLNKSGASEIQHNDADLFSKGKVSMLATLSKVVPGLIAAPLWLYEQSGPNSAAEEVDIEIVGTKGVQFAIHGHGQWNVFAKLVPGDYSGMHRFDIAYDAGKSVIWSIDGVEVCRATPADLVPGGVFPSRPLKAFVSLWASGNAGWAGQWVQTDVTLTLHGYGLAKAG